MSGILRLLLLSAFWGSAALVAERLMADMGRQPDYSDAAELAFFMATSFAAGWLLNNRESSK